MWKIYIILMNNIFKDILWVSLLNIITYTYKKLQVKKKTNIYIYIYIIL
jgi:hypothetical protein